MPLLLSKNAPPPWPFDCSGVVVKCRNQFRLSLIRVEVRHGFGGVKVQSVPPL